MEKESIVIKISVFGTCIHKMGLPGYKQGELVYEEVLSPSEAQSEKKIDLFLLKLKQMMLESGSEMEQYIKERPPLDEKGFLLKEITTDDEDEFEESEIPQFTCIGLDKFYKILKKFAESMEGGICDASSECVGCGRQVNCGFDKKSNEFKVNGCLEVGDFVKFLEEGHTDKVEIPNECPILMKVIEDSEKLFRVFQEEVKPHLDILKKYSQKMHNGEFPLKTEDFDKIIPACKEITSSSKSYGHQEVNGITLRLNAIFRVLERDIIQYDEILVSIIQVVVDYIQQAVSSVEAGKNEGAQNTFKMLSQFFEKNNLHMDGFEEPVES